MPESHRAGDCWFVGSRTQGCGRHRTAVYDGRRQQDAAEVRTEHAPDPIANSRAKAVVVSAEPHRAPRGLALMAFPHAYLSMGYSAVGVAPW